MHSKTEMSGKTLSDLIRGFQQSCIVIAGAELDVFTVLHSRPMTATQLARHIKSDPRATAVLLDALAAIRMLAKSSGAKPIYRVPPSVSVLLAETGSQSMLGMARHQGNCLRRWGQLAHVVQQGKPAPCSPSVRGYDGDLVSFIRAMHEISKPMALPLIHSLGPLKFTHLLDLGGASGTWTIPFLRLNPGARATIFDRSPVIPMARSLMRKVGLSRRVKLVQGSYDRDRLPAGVDLVWVSAIVHQNSRERNRRMFAKVFAALVPGGRILIRDIVMDTTRTRPTAGALFAVNMLVGTEGGSSYTFDELREDLTSEGFVKVKYLRRGEGMDSVICGTKQ